MEKTEIGAYRSSNIQCSMPRREWNKQTKSHWREARAWGNNKNSQVYTKASAAACRCCCSSWMICFENTTTAHKSSLLLSRRARKRAKAKAREREKRGKITSHLCCICKKVIAILTVGRCIVFHFLSFLPSAIVSRSSKLSQGPIPHYFCSKYLPTYD